MRGQDRAWPEYGTGWSAGAGVSPCLGEVRRVVEGVGRHVDDCLLWVNNFFLFKDVLSAIMRVDLRSEVGEGLVRRPAWG